MRRLRQILPSPLAGAGWDATTWLGGRPRSPLHHHGLHLQWVQLCIGVGRPVRVTSLSACQPPPHTPGTSYRWGARHAWSAGSPAPCRGGSGASPPSWAPPSSSPPSHPASSSPPSWAPPSVVYPSSCLRSDQQLPPGRRVSFQDDPPAAPAPPADSARGSGTVSPSTPAGSFARPDPASTMRPPRQRRRPPHLDLYTEVWGEPCGSTANSAIRSWQEVPSLRPEVWQQWRCDIYVLQSPIFFRFSAFIASTLPFVSASKSFFYRC
jgi:hypothetical protein